MHVLVKAIAGSRLYGTAREDSDYDYRGVTIEPVNALIGLEIFEQLEEKPDTVIYGLKKFIRLALDNNPNTLDLLFTPQEYWLYSHPLWNDIYSNRQFFLSQRVLNRYLGYARSQLHKITRHRTYAKWMQEDYTPVNQDELKKFEEYKATRNPARLALELECGYDTKHASHLVRLLLQVHTILNYSTFSPVLEGNQLTIVRGVLQGRYSYEKLMEKVNQTIGVLENIPTQLPKDPQYDYIQDIVKGIYLEYLKNLTPA